MLRLGAWQLLEPKWGTLHTWGGALMGVLLILALSRLPEVNPKKKLP